MVTASGGDGQHDLNAEPQWSASFSREHDTNHETTAINRRPSKENDWMYRSNRIWYHYVARRKMGDCVVGCGLVCLGWGGSERGFYRIVRDLDQESVGSLLLKIPTTNTPKSNNGTFDICDLGVVILQISIPNPIRLDSPRTPAGVSAAASNVQTAVRDIFPLSKIHGNPINAIWNLIAALILTNFQHLQPPRYDRVEKNTKWRVSYSSIYKRSPTLCCLENKIQNHVSHLQFAL